MTVGSAHDRMERIEAALKAAFPDAELQLLDESHLHIGHAGAATGLGHFALTIRTQAFAELNMLAQHRAVYAALGDMMTTDIHALRLSTATP